jgi:hypothetical protein
VLERHLRKELVGLETQKRAILGNHAGRSMNRLPIYEMASRYKQEPERGHHARADGRQVPVVGQKLAAADESGLANVLQEHLHEEHALEMPRERVRENVAAQLKDFDRQCPPDQRCLIEDRPTREEAARLSWSTPRSGREEDERWRLPTVSACCALSGISSGVKWHQPLLYYDGLIAPKTFPRPPHGPLRSSPILVTP